MFVIAVINNEEIPRNAFEQTLLVKYSKSFTTAKFQHNMVGVQFTTEQRRHVYGARVQFEWKSRAGN